MLRLSLKRLCFLLLLVKSRAGVNCSRLFDEAVESRSVLADLCLLDLSVSDGGWELPAVVLGSLSLQFRQFGLTCLCSVAGGGRAEGLFLFLENRPLYYYEVLLLIAHIFLCSEVFSA